MTKLPSKVVQKNSNLLFFLAAQKAQTEELMFQNVAYEPAVYRTGVLTLFNKKTLLTSILLPKNCFVIRRSANNKVQTNLASV